MRFAKRLSLAADRRGAVALLAALLLVPLLLAGGAAIDFSRIAHSRTMLQNAVDNAALAGAAAYSAANQNTAAATVAQRYFQSYPLSSNITLTATSPSVQAAQGSTPSGAISYNVTVSAQGTVKGTLLAAFGFSQFSVSAAATAANPLIVPQLSTSKFSASAADWNRVYVYGVPIGTDGKPQWGTDPKTLPVYKLGDNCGTASNIYCASSDGTQWPNEVSNLSDAKITATQPIAFALMNITNGLGQTGSTGYGNNQYKSFPATSPPAGATGVTPNVFSSAYLANGQSPSQYTNYSYTTKTTNPRTHKTTTTIVTTTYPTTSSSSTSNCSLIVQPISDINNPPTSPPSTSGQCYSPTSTAVGSQYAALSCSQMAGRVFMYWWNDMGGSTDDKDYNDSYYAVTCTPGNTYVSNGTKVVASDLAVELIN